MVILGGKDVFGIKELLAFSPQLGLEHTPHTLEALAERCLKGSLLFQGN